MKGRIHSFESFGTVDGPGIRFVIFTQGCPLRCKYCHNPDTWSYKDGKEYEVEEVVNRILKYKSYFSKGGGVTVSGGEPLVQIDFVIELFKQLKKYNIHTCVDTSGIMFVKKSEKIVEKYRQLFEVCDLFLLDLKHINSKEHEELTGLPNEKIIDYANFLSECDKDVWIRHVLVPGYTTNRQYLIELRRFVETLKNVKKIEVLPYHTMGTVKYQQMGISYPLEGVEPPTKDQIEEAESILVRGEY